jgi:O-acetyl-ADP-ribose deacetylase (regulator of RNase III)
VGTSKHNILSTLLDPSIREATLLKSAHFESLKLASARKIKSIAFPAISTGIYGYPVHDAATIALKTTIDYLKEHRDIEYVRFILFDRTTYDIFTEELKKLL